MILHRHRQTGGPDDRRPVHAVPALAPTTFLAGGTLPPVVPPADLPSMDEDDAPRAARPLRTMLVVEGLGALVAAVAVLGALVLAGCNGPRVISERPVLVTGERVPDAAPGAAASRVADAQRRMRNARDSTYAAAAATCVPEACAALARGEVVPGMTEAQVHAATRSAADAWSVRDAGGATVMVPASLAAPPADAAGEVAMVQLREGRVTSVSYREGHGLRVVESAAEATTAGRARATGEALVREGDALAAAGDRAGALDRYDRALVLLPDDAMLQYRVATLLDQQLRPVEALIRYQRFLHQLDLERIRALGDANAKLAEAIARAQQRIIVLERRGR